MKAWPILLAALAGAWTVAAQDVRVANPSFEDGVDAPAGWRHSGGGQGTWLDAGAADGRRAVAVTGDGKGSSSWRTTAPLPLEPSAVYRLSFKARSVGAGGASGGTAISGPPFANRDLGTLSGDWRSFDSIFLTPADLRPDDAYLRFGHWEVRGTVAFDAVQLRRALPVYARAADADADADAADDDDGSTVILGEGERLVGNDYSFVAPLTSESGNHSRPLAAFSANFNTHRFAMHSPASHLTFRHEVGRRSLTRAEVSAGVIYHVAGRLVAEASVDGATWKALGSLDKVGAGSWPVPAEMLPARTLHVRLRAEPAGDDQQRQRQPNLQVAAYDLRATVDGPPLTLVGSTRFATILSSDQRYDVSIEDVGALVPGPNVLSLRLRARAPGATVQPKVVVEQPGRAPAVADARFRIDAAEQVLRIPFEVPAAGPGLLRLTLGEDVAFAAEVAFRIPDLHEASYGQRLSAEDADVGLWWASSGWKVSRQRPMPRAAGQAIVIQAAKNEAEAAQLVLRPKRALRGLTASVAGSLAGPDGATIPADAVDLLRVRYVPVTIPTDASSAPGDWPDPLPPIRAPLDLEPGHNQPLWVRVKVPRDARAGLYRGAVRLAANGGFAADVPIHVEVFDFALPDRMTCVTTFGFSPGEVFRYQKLTREEDRRAVLAKYWRNFADHHISPYDPAPLDPIKVTWPPKEKAAEVGPTLDFARWDRAMQRAIDAYHFNAFVIHIPGMGGGTFHQRWDPELQGFKEGTPEYRNLFTSYCRTLEAHLREKGWLDEAYVYWFDEPDPKDYEFVNRGFARLRQAAPGLNLMLTEQPEPALFGGPNIWCPITPEFRPDVAAQRRRAGERFWWYVCTGPKAPYATLFIDHPATELRVWLWQTWQRDIDGILVWQSNYWTSSTAYPDRDRPQDPYADPMGWLSGYGAPRGARMPWGNGDGRFIYPPEAASAASPPGPVLDGPVDSIRWEMLRDGVEDYEYLAMLRRELEARKATLPPGELAALRALLEVPPDVTSDMTSFTRDPAPIERRRQQVARALEKLLAGR